MRTCEMMGPAASPASQPASQQRRLASHRCALACTTKRTHAHTQLLRGGRGLIFALSERPPGQPASQPVSAAQRNGRTHANTLKLTILSRSSNLTFVANAPSSHSIMLLLLLLPSSQPFARTLLSGTLQLQLWWPVAGGWIGGGWGGLLMFCGGDRWWCGGGCVLSNE